MAKDKDEKYNHALSQAEAGKIVREHLNHSDFNDLIIKTLKNHTGFSSVVLKTLLLSAPFWGWIFFVSLSISLLVVKFPTVAEWIASLFNR